MQIARKKYTNSKSVNLKIISIHFVYEVVISLA